MSLRVASTSLIPGALVIGGRGLGVLGSAVPATGTHGPSFLYNDLSFPADAAKEVRGLITAWPSGKLAANEDGSFTYAGGSSAFTYQLYVDGALTGPSVVVTLNLGASTEGTSSFSLGEIISASVGEVARPTSEIWDFVLPNGLSAGQNVADIRGLLSTLAAGSGLLHDLAQVHGLIPGEPLVVTPSSRSSGALMQTISQSGDNVTVTRA